MWVKHYKNVHQLHKNVVKKLKYFHVCIFWVSVGEVVTFQNKSQSVYGVFTAPRCKNVSNLTLNSMWGLTSDIYLHSDRGRGNSDVIAVSWTLTVYKWIREDVCCVEGKDVRCFFFHFLCSRWVDFWMFFHLLEENISTCANTSRETCFSFWCK